MEHFDIEKQFAAYMLKLNITKQTMPPSQLRDIQRAFVAGVTNFYTYLQVATEHLDNDEGARAMDKLQNDINRFWENNRPEPTVTFNGNKLNY